MKLCMRDIVTDPEKQPKCIRPEFIDKHPCPKFPINCQISASNTPQIQQQWQTTTLAPVNLMKR